MNNTQKLLVQLLDRAREHADTSLAVGAAMVDFSTGSQERYQQALNRQTIAMEELDAAYLALYAECTRDPRIDW